jgi:phage/plasmid-like protein (TIGR03299 family)
MSHEVEMINGEGQMFTVKQKAWHGLGRVLAKAPETSKEAITLAGLDWGVEKREVYWKTPDTGEFYRIPDRVSLVRTSDQKPLSIVSDHYRVLQNSEAFEFFDPIIKEGKATYETAGSLCGGRVIWVMANLNRAIEVVKGDEIRRYLLLSNSHGFNKSVQIMTCSTRVVCLNTLNMALASGGAYGIWHQGNMKAEMDKVKELLGFAEKKV